MKKNKSAQKSSEIQAEVEEIDLRSPWLAALLTWLVPGAGHFYQRRYFKAAVFAVSIWTLIVAGLAMGTYSVDDENGASRTYFARNVYYSWRPGDRRIAFIPQACVAVYALPALANRNALAKYEEYSFRAAAFAPPRLDSEPRPRFQPTQSEIAANLHSWLDVGLLYTMTAGFLNLLAIFDALGGPSPNVEEKEDDDEKDDEENDDPKTEKK